MFSNMSPAVTITSGRVDDDGQVDVTLAGELDIASADRIAADLTAAAGQVGCRRVRIDVAALTFVDSCGIGALMQASNAAAVAGATLTLADPRPAVRRVLEVTGLAAHFGLAPNAT